MTTIASCATLGGRTAGGACAPENNPWMRYLRSRYETAPHGSLVTDPAICRKASEALSQRDPSGRYYDVLVLPLGTGEYAVIAPALGVSSAGEFDCVVHLDAKLRYKAHICG
jgi:hypothetical protein